MNILLFSPVLPYPLHDGLRLRINNLFKVLGARHEIDLLCFVENDMDKEEYVKKLNGIFRNIQIVRHIPYWKNMRRGYKKIIDIFNFDTSLYCESTEMQSKLSYTLNHNKYDLIFCMGIEMIPYLDRNNNIPIIIDMVDSLTLPLYRDFKITKGIINRARILKRLFIKRQWERKYLRVCKKVVVVSQKDADSIRKSSSHIQTEIIYNGVDTDYFIPKQILQNVHSLLFTGVMEFLPNVQAMLYFAQDIFPQLEKQYPNIILNIVGKSPVPEIIKLNSLNNKIDVSGFVYDMRPYFEKSSVYICPMISGTGIKNKILEAFAMKKAVVATALACEGIEATHGKHLLIARNTKDFIEFVIHLLKDDKLRRELGENARTFVENNYSWIAQVNKLDHLLKEITKKDN